MGVGEAVADLVYREPLREILDSAAFALAVILYTLVFDRSGRWRGWLDLAIFVLLVVPLVFNLFGVR